MICTSRLHIKDRAHKRGPSIRLTDGGVGTRPCKTPMKPPSMKSVPSTPSYRMHTSPRWNAVISGAWCGKMLICPALPGAITASASWAEMEPTGVRTSPCSMMVLLRGSCDAREHPSLVLWHGGPHGSGAWRSGCTSVQEHDCRAGPADEPKEGMIRSSTIQ